MNLKQPFTRAKRLSNRKELLAKFEEYCRMNVGKDNSVSQEAMSVKLFGRYNDTTRRTLRLFLSDCNERGVEICTNSDEGGFYFASNRQELSEYIAREITSKKASYERKESALLASALFGSGVVVVDQKATVKNTQMSLLGW